MTDVLNGAGMHFMSVLAAQSGNLNFLEGCYHAYAPYNEVHDNVLCAWFCSCGAVPATVWTLIALPCLFRTRAGPEQCCRPARRTTLTLAGA